MIQDAELLARYAGQRSEAAFAELVHRHVHVVHATALRLAGGDTQLAQDVTQTVFIELARQAGQLTSRPLAGWLYTTARFTAAKAVRSEVRRRSREQEASAMQANDPHHEANWDQLRPVLDAAMGELPDDDREAVLLRFFHGQEFRSVGTALGVTEEAARKRVERAVEKLRLNLQSRGLTLTGAALAAALAVCSPPASAELAAAVTGAALAGGALASATSLSLTQLFIMTKTKLAAALALAALAVTTSYIATSSSPTLDAMSENPASSKQDGAYSRTASETTPLTAANHSATPPILQRHFDELKDKAQRGRRQAPDPDSWMAAELSQAQKEEPGVKKFYAQFHGSVKAGETLLTGGWETTPGTHTFALIRTFSMANDREDVANIEAKLFSVKTSGAQNGAAFLVDQAAFDPNSGQSHLAGVLSDDQIKLLMDTAERSNGTEVLAAPRISSNLGGAAEMRVGNVVPNSIDGGNHFLGTKVSILPIARNGEALEFSTVVLISQLAQ